MTSRLFSLLATAGLVLAFVVVAIPASHVVATPSGGNPPPCGGVGCEAEGMGVDLHCSSTQPTGACTGQSCSCTSGRNPVTAEGTCGCRR